MLDSRCCLSLGGILSSQGRLSELATTKERQQALAARLEEVQAEWSARESAADSVVSGLRGEHATLQRALKHAEQAAAAAQETAASEARAAQEARAARGELVEQYRGAEDKLSMDVEAYRRSEAHLQQQLEQAETALQQAAVAHEKAAEEASSIHLTQMKGLMQELNQREQMTAAEKESLIAGQRELAEAEKKRHATQKASLQEKQELELGLIEATNKVKELKEVLRVSIAKEARSAASARELSHCVRAQREKLVARDEECNRLQEENNACHTELAEQHQSLEGQGAELAKLRPELAKLTKTLDQAEAEAAEVRGTLSAKVEELKGAVSTQAAAAAAAARAEAASACEAAETALRVKEAVCADQVRSALLTLTLTQCCLLC